MKSIYIDIVDDHKLLLSGLQNVIQAFPNMRVKNLYSSGTDLLKGLRSFRPDVLLLDIQMPDISGEELAPILTRSYPSIRVLVTTGFDTTYHIKSMMEKGVHGYILKNADGPMLKKAIETVYRGLQFIDPVLKEKIVEESLFTTPTSAAPTLTRREKEILTLVMQEKTSQEIAAALKISLRTVENQRINLMQKLEVKNAVGLAKKTIEWQLLK